MRGAINRRKQSGKMANQIKTYGKQDYLFCKMNKGCELLHCGLVFFLFGDIHGILRSWMEFQVEKGGLVQRPRLKNHSANDSKRCDFDGQHKKIII